MGNRISYVIADDHRIFRQGLRMALETDGSLTCMGEAANGRELIGLVKITNPDIAIIDLKMPEMDGRKAVSILKKDYPSLHIIILSMFEDEHYIMHMMEAGVSSYLLKNVDPEEIINAMYSIMETGYYFSRLISNVMLHNIVQKSKIKPRFHVGIELSEREKEILQMICNEKTNQEISQEIFLSQRTVEGIRTKLLEKIGVRNTAGLVLYAVKSGLVVT